MQHSTPYTPQQNGVAERKNRSLKEMETCMIEVREINPKIWDESISYAAHIQNRSFHKSMKGMTPYKAWFGEKLDVSNFRIFRTKSYGRIPSKKRKSLQPQSKEYLMVVYGEETKGYNLFDTSTRRTLLAIMGRPRFTVFNQQHTQLTGPFSDRPRSGLKSHPK